MKLIISIIFYCYLFISKWFPEKNHWQPQCEKSTSYLKNTWDVVVILSDLHFFSYFSKPQVFEKIIKHELSILPNTKTIKFIVLGDLFDSQKGRKHLSAKEKAVLELLEKHQAFALIGDHDSWLNKSNITSLKIFEEIVLQGKKKKKNILLTHGDELQKMQFNNASLVDVVILPTYYSIKFFGHTLKITWAKKLLDEIKKSAKIQAELLFAAKKAAQKAKQLKCKTVILAHFHTLLQKIFKIRKSWIHVLISDGSYDNPESYIVIKNGKVKRKKIST